MSASYSSQYSGTTVLHPHGSTFICLGGHVTRSCGILTNQFSRCQQGIVLTNLTCKPMFDGTETMGESSRTFDPLLAFLTPVGIYPVLFSMAAMLTAYKLI